MLSLALEIINFMVLALLLGTVLGYLLSRAMVREVRTSVEQLKLDVAGNRKRLSGAETDLQLHKRSLNELRAAQDGQQERLSMQSDRMADLSGQMEGLTAGRSALSERTAALASQLTEGQASLGRQLEASQLTLTSRIESLVADRDAHAQRLIALEGTSDHLLGEHRALVQRVQTMLASAPSDSPAANEALVALSERLNSLENQLVASERARAALADELTSLVASQGASQGQLESIRNRIDVLGEADSVMSSRLESLSGLPLHITGLHDSQQDLEGRLQALEALPDQFEATRTHFERMQSTTAALTSRLEHQDRWGQETEDRIEALEARVNQGDRVSRSSVPAPAPDGPDERPYDNLKRIRGVGVALERVLNQAGIRYFEQVAAWTPTDIQRFSGLLEKFQGRIIRDDWVAQAKALIEEDAKAAGQTAQGQAAEGGRSSGGKSKSSSESTIEWT